MTESVVMSEGIVHSTPISNNRVENNEIMKMMQMLFSEQKSLIREVQDNCNVKLEELKNEIQRQRDCNINKVDDNYDIKMGVENGGETDKLNENENKDDKVSRGENYDKISKIMVLENNGVNIESGDEILEEAGCNNGMLVCIDESERKWRESIKVEGLQGVNFSRGVVGGEEKASRVYLGDILSANSGPLIFCASDRWCSNKVVVPPAYIERESGTCCYDEGYFERERERERYGDRKIELFEVGRNYKELIEKINNERVDYIKGLPCEVISTAVVDENDDDNNDFITYLVGTDNT